ncbi:MAG: hypothetical protein AB7G75_05810 [Candidatus Binatia bacterium]
MFNGPQTLTRIDQNVQQVRQELLALEAQIQQVGDRLAAVRQRESETYRKLARFRIDSVQAENVAQALDSAERQAQALLTEREQVLTRLVTQIDAAQRRQTELENARQQQNVAVEEITRTLQATVDRAHKGLATVTTYQAQQKIAQNAVNIVTAAEEKTARAEADKEEKGKPYLADRLFVYLWKRGYGTSAYHAGPLARMGDTFVARHIGFEQARRNYAMLLDLPTRLREHVDRLQKQADAEMQKLAALERAAEEAEGSAALEQQMAAAKAKLQELDHAIADEEKRYATLLQQREPYTVGEDRHFQQALELLVTSLRAEPLPQLRHEAELTPGREDDSEVQELLRLQHEEETLERTLQDNRSVHQRNLQRLHELEEVRRRFKQYDYDAPYSDFGNADAVSILLGEFLRGMINVEQLWQTIQRNQRFRRPPFSPRSSDVGFPDAFRFPRGVQIPGGWGGGNASRESGSGGFRTGGGF